MKLNKLLLALALVIGWQTTSFAQTATPSQTPPTADDSGVVKISTQLIQVDAVVTDKDGNGVTNLTAADFEVLQDGKPQKVTNFLFVNTDLSNQKPATAAVKPAKNNKNIPIPSTPVRAGAARRLLTFIVDDGSCRTSQVGMVAARETLQKFVNEQMQPNDSISIYQTRGGSSLLQQYSSDKAELLRVIRKIRWYPASGSCARTSGEVFESARNDSTLNSNNPTFENENTRAAREESEKNVEDNQTIGTLGVVRYVVRGLQRISGRKTVFLMSDGISIRDRNGSNRRAFDILRELSDEASRAGVVFHTIDVRGTVDSSMISASDDVSVSGEIDAANPTGTEKIVADRTSDYRNSQEGLFVLADATGGRFYQGSSALDNSLRRALNLEKGYYLLAYQPDNETFKGKKYHKIEVKLNRPDLRVQSRSGFYGVTDEELRPKKKRTADSELYESIAAPLPIAGLDLRLSAFYKNTPTEGNFVRSLIYIDGKDISFTDDANNTKKAVFDVVAVTMNQKNEVADEFNRTHTLPRLTAEQAAAIQRSGLIYTSDVPVKTAGAYTVRVAVRDASSKQIGSASQVIEVPDLKKGKLFLAGLTASAADNNGKFVSPSGAKPEAAFSPVTSSSVPAIRQFRPGSVLAYAYTLYNAQIDKTANQPKLTTQIRLYRDGELVFEEKPQPARLEPQTDMTRINNFGYLVINAQTVPGDYALQVILTDTLSKQTSTQSIDFEVVK